MTRPSPQPTPAAISQALEHLAAAGLSFDIVDRCGDANCAVCRRDAELPTAA